MRIVLSVTAGPAKGKKFTFDKPDCFLFGRAKDARVSLPKDPYVSRQHFLLEIAPPNCKVTDLESKNGTFVNDVRYGGRKPPKEGAKLAPAGVTSILLADGSEIVVGDTRMMVYIEAADDETRSYMSDPATQVDAAHAKIPSSQNLAGMPTEVEHVPQSNPEAVDGSMPSQFQTVVEPSGLPVTQEVAPPKVPQDPPVVTSALTRVENNAPPANLPSVKLSAFSRNETVKDASVNPFESFGESFSVPPPPPFSGTRSKTVREADASEAGTGQEILCLHCKREVTKEAGLRGQVRGAEYICVACRQDAIQKNREPNDPSVTAVRDGPPQVIESERSIGDVIDGYRITGVLGRGGMGVVYKGVDVINGRVVAIKMLLPKMAVSFNQYRSFHREIELTRQLKHINIVELITHGKVRGAYYCVLEYVDGMDLRALMEERGGKLELDEAIPIMLGTLQGLAHAHRAEVNLRAGGRTQVFKGVVHRDLKPENIFLAKDGDSWIPKVADFGISKSFESAGMTDMTMGDGVCGTPVYWPREQITHYRYLHPATDVFSIACVFYEALTGKWPRPGMRKLYEQRRLRKMSPDLGDLMLVISKNAIPSLRDLVPMLPLPVGDVFNRALGEAEVPSDDAQMRKMLSDLRYADAGAFLEAMTSSLRFSGYDVPPARY